MRTSLFAYEFNLEQPRLKNAAFCLWNKLDQLKLKNAALCHPWHRVIPPIPGHKKGRKSGLGSKLDNYLITVGDTIRLYLKID